MCCAQTAAPKGKKAERWSMRLRGYCTNNEEKLASKKGSVDRGVSTNTWYFEFQKSCVLKEGFPFRFFLHRGAVIKKLRALG